MTLIHISNLVRLCASVLSLSLIIAEVQYVSASPSGELICPADRPQKPKGVARDQVYVNSTYKAGEVAEYSLHYGVALVGTATFQVMSPYKYKGSYDESLWHRRVRIEAKTGDWYKYILVGRALVDSWIRPWDGGASRYYMELDYGAMFGSQTSQKKWFDFYSEKCRVNQKVEEGGKSKDEEFDLSFGARDIVSATYWLRELNYTIGKVEKTMVFTSGKNWWLNVTPLQDEKLKTEKLGEIETTKLKVQTFIGEKLEQKGDMFIWIEKNDPRRMVKADGEVKIGHVKIDLISYKKN